jgi:hypothetical protein
VRKKILFTASFALLAANVMAFEPGDSNFYLQGALGLSGWKADDASNRSLNDSIIPRDTYYDDVQEKLGYALNAVILYEHFAYSHVALLFDLGYERITCKAKYPKNAAPQDIKYNIAFNCIVFSPGLRIYPVDFLFVGAGGFIDYPLSSNQKTSGALTKIDPPFVYKPFIGVWGDVGFNFELSGYKCVTLYVRYKKSMAKTKISDDGMVPDAKIDSLLLNVGIGFMS